MKKRLDMIDQLLGAVNPVPVPADWLEGVIHADVLAGRRFQLLQQAHNRFRS
jgi:hypothetical protein